MRQIICDRCSRECHGTHGRLMLTRASFTSGGEQVGHDDFDALDLCDICTEVARTEWGFKVSQPEWKTPEEGYSITVMGGGGGESVPGASGGPGEIGHAHGIGPDGRCEDCEPLPGRLAVGMTVTREIATRWNLRNFATPAEELTEEPSACIPELH